jgi:hypothetical protein
MGRTGLAHAKKVGRRLPKFGSLREARSRLFAERTGRLERLKALAKQSDDFRPDFTPESLKKIEAWYFALIEGRAFRSLGTTRAEFESCMTSYFCQVIVATCRDAQWVVEEYPFVRGRYEIGVRHGFGTWASSFEDHYRFPGNTRRTRIYREYEKVCRW